MRSRACGCRRRTCSPPAIRVLIAVIDSGVDTQHPELAGLILDTFDAIGTGDRTHAHGTSIVGAIAARVAAARHRARRPHPGRARVRHPARQHGRHHHRHHQGDRVGDAARRARHQYELCRFARSMAIERRLATARAARHHPGRGRRQRRADFGAALSGRQSRRHRGHRDRHRRPHLPRGQPRQSHCDRRAGRGPLAADGRRRLTAAPPAPRSRPPRSPA